MPSAPRPVKSESAPLKTRFILNPVSGAAARLLPAVRAHAAARGAALALTARPGHAEELAARALDDGCGLVVAVGGDGTLNEVARVLIGSGAILGLVPGGSGDGLGRHLGLHGPADRALRILDTGVPRLIDTGLAAGRPFVTAAGVGLEAEIALRFNRLRRRGLPRYLSTAFATWRAVPPADFRVTAGDRRETIRAHTVAVANADQYGNNARIAPAARVDDGRLDLCAVPPITWFNAPRLAFALFSGRIAAVPAVRSFRSDRFVVERPAPGPFHTDGETHAGEATVEFLVRPASLRIMVPA